MSDRAAPAWLTQWEFAHRGKHAQGVPENSLAAAKAAITAGMGIECDIQRSSDGEAMVFHDWELKRLTNSAGATNAFSAAELESFALQDTSECPIDRKSVV